MAGEIDFKREDPPRKGVGGRHNRLSDRLGAELDKLRSDPGTWYRLLVYDKYNGAARSLTLQVPDCEFVGRHTRSGNFVVYGRYVGEHGEHVPE